MGKFIFYLLSLVVVVVLIFVGVAYIQDYFQKHPLDVKILKETKEKSIGLNEKYIKNISISDINSPQPKVVIEFDEKGKEILEKAMRKNRDAKIILETEGKKWGEYSIAIDTAGGKLILSGFMNTEEAKKFIESIKISR
jgi:preprotein translocase subunit SecD